MAKKSRRRKKRGRTRLSEAQLVRPDASEAVSSAAAVSTAEGPFGLQEEYGRVAADLRRMGIVAAVILVAVVVLVVVLV